MTYDPPRKAQALALLLTGDTPRYVAKATGVPRTTLRRWQANELRDLRRTLLPLRIPGWDFGRLAAAEARNPSGLAKAALKTNLLTDAQRAELDEGYRAGVLSTDEWLRGRAPAAYGGDR